ncbi:MAG: hypothetical protein K0U40_03855 [Betaproteobacteria bacterium]|nr:hypothetical protein [Betaproteobacteria bacterium]
MYKFLSTGLVLIGALLLNASAVASQDCDNYGANMQTPYSETEIAASTSCINDDRSTEWHSNVLANAEIPGINSLDQSATCIAANCRSRLKPAPSQTSTSLSTPEMTRGLDRSITVISSLDQSATCIVANCRSRLQHAPSHPSV